MQDPDTLVDLTTARTDFEAELIVNTLHEAGIRAHAFSTAGMMLQWDVASMQPIRVAVRRADLERAGTALKGIRQESVDIDWSEVDTGELIDADLPRCAGCGYSLDSIKPGAPCPECGKPNGEVFESVMKRSLPRSVWCAIAVVVILLLIFGVWAQSGS